MRNVFAFVLLLVCSTLAHAGGFSVAIPGTTCSLQNVTGVSVDASGVVHYAGASTSGTCSSAPTNPTNPPPVQTACAETQTADIAGYTRSCNGTVNHSGTAPVYNGPLDQYTPVFGSYPVSDTYSGVATIFPLEKAKYLSFQFTPSESGSVKFTTNTSWGSGGAISVSTMPGQFKSTICNQWYGGSNNLLVTNNGFSSAQCKLTKGQTYYLNFVDIYSDGSPGCAKTVCNIAYTVLLVN